MIHFSWSISWNKLKSNTHIRRDRLIPNRPASIVSKMKLVSLTIALMCVSVFLASSVPVVDAAGGSRLTRNTKSAKSNKKYKDDFKYPKDMPPPPEMWVEGFASRLHAQNIQKYETPIQVWQTWRLDQMMWNCVAHYHPTALHAITKSAPVPRVP